MPKSEFTRKLLDMLAGRLSELDLDEPEFEAKVMGLTGQPRRLFIFLSGVPGNESHTTEIRQCTAIGNISDAANRLNTALAKLGDHRRVLCVENRHIINRFDEPGRMGRWRIVGLFDAANDAGDDEAVA